MKKKDLKKEAEEAKKEAKKAKAAAAATEQKREKEIIEGAENWLIKKLIKDETERKEKEEQEREKRNLNAVGAANTAEATKNPCSDPPKKQVKQCVVTPRSQYSRSKIGFVLAAVVAVVAVIVVVLIFSPSSPKQASASPLEQVLDQAEQDNWQLDHKWLIDTIAYASEQLMGKRIISDKPFWFRNGSEAKEVLIGFGEFAQAGQSDGLISIRAQSGENRFWILSDKGQDFGQIIGSVVNPIYDTIKKIIGLALILGIVALLIIVGWWTLNRVIVIK